MTTGPVLPELSFAKNFRVEFEFVMIPEIGDGPLGLDNVGVEPSVV